MNVRTSTAVLGAVAVTLLITQPWVDNSTHTVETVVHRQVEQVTETIDLERLRNVEPASAIDEQLNQECAYALQRLTDEPLMGIMLYAERWYHGDTCQAYEHQVEHGWY